MKKNINAGLLIVACAISGLVYAMEESIDQQLLTYSRLGDYGKVRELLLKNANPNIQDNLAGGTPLHIAASGAKANILDVLLQNNANPNMQDFEGNTALHVAALSNLDSIVKKLLQAGANPAITNHQRYTPLDLASSPATRELLQQAMYLQMLSGPSFG